MDGTTSRSVRRCLGVCGAFALAVGFAAAGTARGEAPTLRWKFTPGETLHYQMEQKSVTEVKAGGQQGIKTTVTQILDTTWTVQSVDPSGTAEWTQSIDRLRSKIDSSFGTMDFDSKSEKAPEGPIASGVVPVYKALVGAKFRYKMSPRGELSDIQVSEGLVKSLKEAGPTAANSGMLSEEGLREMIRESSLVLPDQPLDKPWTRQKKIPMPPIGTQVVDITYKYDGAENGVDKIATETKVTLEPDPKSNIDAKIGSQQGTGGFSFDGKAGRVVGSKTAQKIEMVVNVMNSQVTQSNDTTTEMKLVKAEEGAAK